MLTDFYGANLECVPSVPVYERRQESGAPGRYGFYLGAGGASRLVFEQESSLPAAATMPQPQELLAAALSQLNATRAQLGEALGVGRQRIYQLLDGERPRADTLIRLQRLAQLADDWRDRHARPMGMILPKPAALLDGFWGELAKSSPDEAVIRTVMEQLAQRHDEFEARSTRQAQLRANAEPGMVGLLPPRGYYDSDSEG